MGYHDDLRFQILLWISINEVDLDHWEFTSNLFIKMQFILFKIINYYFFFGSLLTLNKLKNFILSVELHNPVASFITLNLKVSRKYLGMVGWLPKDFIHNTKWHFIIQHSQLEQFFFFNWNNKSPLSLCLGKNLHPYNRWICL